MGGRLRIFAPKMTPPKKLALKDKIKIEIKIILD